MTNETKKVLIVDDDETIRDLNGTLLECLYTGTVEITYADNGETLVEMMRNNKYDLVLTDNTMPKLTGISAIKKIREFDKITPIYVIATLTDQQSEDMKSSGHTGYIPKGDSLYSPLEKVIKEHLI